MQRHFDEALEQLKQKLLRMSSLVEQSIGSSIKALMDRNAELAYKVIKADDAVNMLEIEIDELCLKLLALHQPTAGDLRFITSTMKINNDLERIGDLAVNIGQRTLDLIKVPPLKLKINIPKMATAAQAMLKDSLNAFVNKDSKLAYEVCKRDDEVDDLNHEIFMELLSCKPEDLTPVERVIDLVLVAKNLERVADHSTNICEDIIYMVDGKVIKHHITD
ncbi:MAG: phosphate transport system regulatory protein PhoU [Omnitrophica WOR_2 bacterium RIFCSPHIGHO2_01_FULL_48_9]|nr:MAG: phosphate transport system regulatory protein PhoU [Omnitrophica WOR_2 bacterium RIFCSPHIGHO2_02_FULL_48_11]OGX31068.1 MAG: phosphate transport system regulatory protein PhoU [Omnitrophica WOR_2 bacterium RIFCSPHIGHO2_01_FULL_48_9]